MFSDSTVRLTRGPRETRAPPAVDVTFRSAARNFERRCIVVRSGMLDDGTAGLWAIADQGGATMCTIRTMTARDTLSVAGVLVLSTRAL